MSDDHERLIRVAANWERLHSDVFVKAQRLTAENERLRALLSWVEGMLIDEADHMVIREAINRWREDVNLYG